MDKPQTTLNIEKLGNDFEGVCYVKGKRCLVKGALPKERVIVDNPRVSGNITIYELVKVATPSKDREINVCSYQKDCGACTLSHIKSEAQRKYKTDSVKRRLNEWRNLVEDIEFAQNPKRNKIQFSFKGAGEDMQIGFFNSETHAVSDIPLCKMHDESAFVAIRQALKDWCRKYSVIAYNPKRQRGNLRFCVLRILGNALLLTLVFFKDNHIEGLSYLYSKLKEYFDLVSLNININSQISNSVFDNTPTYFIGEKEIGDAMLGIKYFYRAGDFLQTNTEICERIYGDILLELETSKTKNVIDAYSGIGITSSLFAKHGMRVKSVEINEFAVQTARNTAKLNGVDNAIELHSGDFASVLKTMAIEENTTLFVDPPRAGLGESVCRAILKNRIEKIIYLSCELDTMLSDLNILKTNYRVSKIKPYDMFPNTKHIETLCIMERI